MKTPTLLNIRILLTILMLGMGSSVWADKFEYTLTVPTDVSPSYGETSNTTVNGIEWSVPGRISGSTWCIGGSKNSNINRDIQSKSPFNATINRITVNHQGKSLDDITINSATLIVATNASFNENSLIDKRTLSSSLSITTEPGSFSFTPNQYSPKWPRGCYYKITINYTNSNKDKNGGLNLSSIEFTGDTEAEYPKNFTWLSSSLEGSANGTEVGKVTAENAPVTIAFGAGTETIPTYDATEKAVKLRFRNKIAVSAPEGYAINGITIHHSSNENVLTPSIGTCAYKKKAPDNTRYTQTWTGLSPHVIINQGYGGEVYSIYRIHVSYVPLTPEGTITVNQFGTATYCPCESPIVVGDGTLTMMAIGTDDNVIKEENIPVVPVGTGVLIHGANRTYNCYTSASLSTPSAATLSSNRLVGVTADISAPVGSYVLQNHTDDGFGFYQVNDFQPTVGQGKAYLQLPPNSANTRVIYFTQEEADQHATAILSTPANDPTSAIYHLSGLRLSKLQKGVNIIRRADGTVIKKVLP